MARFITKRERGFIWIPPNVFSPIRKVEVILKDNTVQTLTDDCLNINVNISNTQFISSFNINIVNDGVAVGEYTDMFTGGEDMQIWLGYGSNLTKVFRGQVERVYNILSNSGHIINLTGRDYGSQLLKKTFSSTYTSREVSDIIKNSSDGIIPSFTSGITTNNVETTSTTLSEINFKQPKVFDSLKQLSKKSNSSFYIDTDIDLNFFAKYSRQNLTEAAVAGVTIKDLNMGFDIKDVKNRIKVNGKNYAGDVLLLKTANDLASQSLYGINEFIVNDSSITTMDEIDERAASELFERKDLLKKGAIPCLGMPTLKQGEQLRVSSPFDKINGFFLPSQIIHNYDNNGFTTSLIIEEIINSLVVKLRDREISEKNIYDLTNPNNMGGSYVLIFTSNDNIGNFGDTELDANGFLKLKIGVSNGSMISISKSLSFIPSKAELRIDGESLGVSTIQANFDSLASSYQTLTNKVKTNITNQGDEMRIKINLVRDSNNTEPIVRNVGILFKE